MVPVALSDVVAVGEVPTAAEVKILANAGFRAILNTQPDGEVERLATAAELSTLATASGLTYRHVPVPSRRPGNAVLAQFAEALATLPRPIYACCYSGARTAAAWALAAAPHQDADTIVAACLSAGYDIEFLRPQIIAQQTSASTVAAAPPPAIAPKPMMPRAATVGGFTVPG